MRLDTAKAHEAQVLVRTNIERLKRLAQLKRGPLVCVGFSLCGSSPSVKASQAVAQRSVAGRFCHMSSGATPCVTSSCASREHTPLYSVLLDST